MIDLVTEIWQTLCTNKLRTFLTGFSVAWGIFMLIILVGMAKGVMTSFQDGGMAQSSNNIQIWNGFASMPYQGLKEGRFIDLKDKNLAAIEHENASHVSEVTAQLSPNSSVTLSTPRDSKSKSYVGVFPSEINSQHLVMSEGRFINENDMNKMRKVVVLDRNTVQTLFGDTTNVVGRNVSINGLNFTVIGWYYHQWRNSIYIPFSTARAINGYTDKLDQIRVGIKNVKTEEDGENVEKAIRTTLSKQNKFDPDDQGAVYTWNQFTSYLTNLKAMSILNITMWVIGLLTLITGIVGVSNIMFVSVRERTHEIGIRRAIGAKPANILIQVIVESVALTTVFGYIGILMGTIGTEIIAHAFAGSDFIKDPRVDITLALEVTAVLVVAGALAGLFPALKALKVKPVEALRTE